MPRDDSRRGNGRAKQFGGSSNEYDQDYERGFRPEPYRPGWPEQRGSFGERDYGQGEQPRYRDADPMYGPHWYQQGGSPEGSPPRGESHGFAPAERARREAAYSWPRESMGPGGGVPYYGGSSYASAPNEHYPYGRSDVPEYGEGAWWFSPENQRSSGQPSFVGRGPKGYQRSDDRIHEEICEKLTKDPMIDATHIEIAVKDGEVTLSGHVHERRFKHRAENVVESVSGVRKIRDQLEIEHHEPGFQREWTGVGNENGRDSEDGVQEQPRERRSKAGAGR